MALDAPSSALVEQAGSTGAPPLHELTPEQARDSYRAMAELVGPGPMMARVSETRIPVADGSTIALRLLVPAPEPPAVIVFFHGGGWVIGDIDTYDAVGRSLAAASGCAVVLVDYRKAPEHPFPAAVADAWAALTWVDDRLAALLGSRVPLIVAGDSAGGNLAALVALRARDEAGPSIAQQVLIYPVTDSDLDNDSYRDASNQLLLRRESMSWFWDHYLPDQAARTDASVSPLRAESLTGLPPTILITAEHDVLRDEGEAYAARLEAAGVRVTSRRFTGQLHGFFTLINVLPGSADAITYVARRIRDNLAGRHD